MSSKLSMQERIRAKKLAKEVTASFSESQGDSRKKLYKTLEAELQRGQHGLLETVLQSGSTPDEQRQLYGFVQQIAETSRSSINQVPVLAELVAVPVILATELQKPGRIEPRLASGDLGPLDGIMQDYFGEQARIQMLDSLYDKDDLDRIFPYGTYALKESLIQSILGQKVTAVPDGLNASAIVTSGRQGENWLLRYLVGVLIRPADADTRQLPALPEPDAEHLKRWNAALSVYLNMHLQAHDTTFDVMLRPPTQLSYALEEGEAAFCMLELEHYGLKRAASVTQAKDFPVVLSYHPAKRILVVTVGKTQDILWDTTIPVYLGDVDAARAAIEGLAIREGLTSFGVLDWPEYVRYRQSLAPRASWLDYLESRP